MTDILGGRGEVEGSGGYARLESVSGFEWNGRIYLE